MNTTTTAQATTVPAWVQHHYGGPDAVVLGHRPIPTPGPDEVLVQVHATGLNAADARLMRGDPYLVRLGFGLARPKQPVRGMDVAGRITAVGAGVSGFAVGDEIVAETNGGGLAPLVVVPAKRLAHRPAGISPEVAAVLPLAGGTALQALDLAGIGLVEEPGPGSESGSEANAARRVLVIGASGGVGTYAVQLARIRGAEVWALCGERSRQIVEDLGAARTFDYRQTVAQDLPPNTFDAIIDIAGTAPLGALHNLLRPGGTLAMVAGGGKVLGPIPRMLRAALLRKRGGRRIRSLMAVAKPEALQELLALAEQGRLHPAIERRYEFAEAAEALAHIDSGRVVGKILVCAARSDVEG